MKNLFDQYPPEVPEREEPDDCEHIKLYYMSGIDNQPRLYEPCLLCKLSAAEAAVSEAKGQIEHLDRLNEKMRQQLANPTERDALRGKLKALLNHWREFGPGYGFDELIEHLTKEGN